MMTRRSSTALLLMTIAGAGLGCVSSQSHATELQSATAESGPPSTLSRTGLYADVAHDQLADGVELFEPTYAHWAEGAKMRRFVKLPPGSKIDTSDMDRWVLPVGTKLWKEVTAGGTRVETRMLVRSAENDWSFVSYAWRGDQSEADIMPLGLQNALDTHHDVPSVGACYGCHGREKVLGFSAVQLSHDGPGLTIRKLSERGQLTVAAPDGFRPRGKSEDVAALGYLHANCGHCHTEKHATGMELRLTTGVQTVSDSAAFRTAVGITTMRDHGGPTTRIQPGNPSASAIHFRMTNQGRGDFLLKLGMRKQDERGMALVDSWIRNLGEDRGYPSSSSISQR